MCTSGSNCQNICLSDSNLIWRLHVLIQLLSIEANSWTIFFIYSPVIIPFVVLPRMTVWTKYIKGEGTIKASINNKAMDFHIYIMQYGSNYVYDFDVLYIVKRTEYLLLYTFPPNVCWDSKSFRLPALVACHCSLYLSHRHSINYCLTCRQAKPNLIQIGPPWEVSLSLTRQVLYDCRVCYGVMLALVCQFTETESYGIVLN